jgi:CMP-N-acetylneuraminic acid synthetase/quercetin dioxygenase-like cupin family protein
MKKIALIPVLLGSTRIPDKNLLLVDGYPMVFYVARACQQAGVFDEIYINSEHETFARIAQMLGVKFYQRKPDRGVSACRMTNKSRQCQGTRCQTNEHFLIDFMETLDPCYLALVHTTSPLLRPEAIKEFMDTLERDEYDSLLSVEERYTEALYGGQPLNFSVSTKVPTQTLQPVQLITWALSAWKTATFMESYRRNDPNESGPTFCGKTGVFPLDRIQALDADTWDDLYMIQSCLQHRRQGESLGQFKFTEEVIGIESCLKDLSTQDGGTKCEEQGAKPRRRNVQEINKNMSAAPRISVLVYTATDQIGLICQRPGEGARKHCHVTHAEWWIVLEGAFEWRLGDGTVITAKKSDVVRVPRGMTHIIVCTSQEPGIRLACGARDMEHIYVK